MSAKVTHPSRVGPTGEKRTRGTGPYFGVAPQEWRSAVKRFLLPVAAAIVVGLYPQSALAQPVSTTEHIFDGTDIVTGDEVCGDVYDLTFTYNGVIHTTEFPDGRTEVNAAFAGEILAEPADGDGPTYEGRSTYTFALQPNSFTSRVFILATGSDGSRLAFSYLIHINSTASGMEVAFEGARCG